MPKNTKGGKKTKKGANKRDFANFKERSQKTRT